MQKKVKLDSLHALIDYFLIRIKKFLEFIKKEYKKDKLEKITLKFGVKTLWFVLITTFFFFIGDLLNNYFYAGGLLVYLTWFLNVVPDSIANFVRGGFFDSFGTQLLRTILIIFILVFVFLFIYPINILNKIKSDHEE